MIGDVVAAIWTFGDGARTPRASGGPLPLALVLRDGAVAQVVAVMVVAAFAIAVSSARLVARSGPQPHGWGLALGLGHLAVAHVFLHMVAATVVGRSAEAGDHGHERKEGEEMHHDVRVW